MSCHSHIHLLCHNSCSCCSIGIWFQGENILCVTQKLAHASNGLSPPDTNLQKSSRSSTARRSHC
jgi:hypothetical protein